MQNFNDECGVRRLIRISSMTVEEADNYVFSQFYREPKEKQSKMARTLKKRIKGLAQQKEEVYEWILAIHTKEGKLIGKMEVYSADAITASIKIEVPDKIKSLNYGVEAIKQFRKICEENHYFKRIELESNDITERYKEAYELDSNFIEINAA